MLICSQLLSQTTGVALRVVMNIIMIYAYLRKGLGFTFFSLYVEYCRYYHPYLICGDIGTWRSWGIGILSCLVTKPLCIGTHSYSQSESELDLNRLWRLIKDYSYVYIQHFTFLIYQFSYYQNIHNLYTWAGVGKSKFTVLRMQITIYYCIMYPLITALLYNCHILLTVSLLCTPLYMYVYLYTQHVSVYFELCQGLMADSFQMLTYIMVISFPSKNYVIITFLICMRTFQKDFIIKR